MDTEIISTQISVGTDVNKVNKYGQIPYMASYNGLLDIVSTLIETGLM